MRKRTDLHRTFCLHCGGIFADIWGLKSHQSQGCIEVRPVPRHFPRRTAILALAGVAAMVALYPGDNAGAAAPVLSAVSAGAAEAPELVTGSAMRIERDEVGTETVDGPHVFVSPAPTPVVAPAPVEVTPPVAALPSTLLASPAPRCYRTVVEYLNEWHDHGDPGPDPCFIDQAPNNQAQPEGIPRSYNGEAY